ncbi:MAG: TRAP transporter fused permease subunit [Pseudomonadota bacterium]
MIESRYRELKGVWRKIEQIVLTTLVLLGALFILDVQFYLGWTVYKEQYLGFFLGLVIVSTFLIVPPSKRSSRTSIPIYDIVFAALGLAVGIYIATFYPKIVNEMGKITTIQVLIGLVALLLVLEASRRLTGWALLIMALLFFIYALFTDQFPGVLFGKATRWDRLINYCYLDSSALLGLPLAISSTIALAFIFFGNTLFATGGGKFLTDFAMATLGRFRGGPAKVAVLASTLFGTLSGVATANVYITGVITIPMMKRVGYKPHVASAIEAVASTGGILMPPVMGIVAFLMADFLGIPFYEIAIAALIPALIYYTVVLVQVDLEAAKENLRGLSRSDLPSLKDALRRSWTFVVPVVVLVYTLFELHFQPEKAAMSGFFSVWIISFLNRKTRMGLRKFLNVVETTGRSVLDIGVMTAIAGVIIGIIFLSGLGFRLSMSLVNLSGGNPLMVLPLAAMASVILGMGMPPAVVYILLAVLIGPAITELGIPSLAAHLFLLYFSTLSMITPPVCLSSFAAANIGAASPLKTGFTSVRLGIAAYFLPFIFVFSPGLLLAGPAKDIALASLTTVVGSIFLAIAFVGFFFQRISLPGRLLVAIAAIGLMFPAGSPVAFRGLINWGGAAILALFVFLQWRIKQIRK